MKYSAVRWYGTKSLLSRLRSGTKLLMFFALSVSGRSVLQAKEAGPSQQCVLAGGMDREMRIKDCQRGQVTSADGTIILSKATLEQFEKSVRSWNEQEKLDSKTPLPIIFPDEKSANPVMKGPRLGYYLKTSKGVVIRQVVFFDNGPDYFEEGLARFISRDGKIGYMNAQLKTVIPAKFDYATPFEAGLGLAVVCSSAKADPCVSQQKASEEHSTVTGGTWSVIDKAGKTVKGPGLKQADAYDFVAKKRGSATEP